MTPRRDLLVAALLLAVILFASPAFPQATVSFAQLNGTVLDTSGRTIASATVTRERHNGRHGEDMREDTTADETTSGVGTAGYHPGKIWNPN